MKLEFFQTSAPEHDTAHTTANAQVQDALLQRYRGFTALPATGAWRHANGTVTREAVEVLTVYTEERYVETFHFLWFTALQYARAAKQEAVLFVIDGKPSLVFANAQEVPSVAAEKRQRHAIAATATAH